MSRTDTLPPLPDFVIGGAQKAGTTALHEILRLHPELHLPAQPQEIHYFDIDEHYRRGPDWYRRHFRGAGPAHVAVGQTCPSYLFDPRVPERMARALPDVRLVFLLRNPVDRAYSHYWHSVKYGFEHLPFEEALARETDRLTGDPRTFYNLSYAARGRYADQLERFLAHYPRERILLLLTEDLNRDPARVLDRCFAFLGVALRGTEIAARARERRWNESRLPRWPRLQALTTPVRSPRKPRLKRLAKLVDRVNLRPARYPPMDPKLRRHLAARFAADEVRLAERFGLDLRAWWEHEAGAAQPPAGITDPTGSG